MARESQGQELYALRVMVCVPGFLIAEWYHERMRLAATHSEVNSLKHVRIPRELRSDECMLRGAFIQLARRTGLTSDEANGLTDLLPLPLQNAPAFRCNLDNTWRYEYGVPYTIGANRNVHVVGTDHVPPVHVLFFGIKKLARFLKPSELRAFSDNLVKYDKHLEYLAELDPILRAKEVTHLQYEPRPLGPSAAGPDWLIVFRDGSSCLIETKCRIKALLKHLNDIHSERGDTNPHPTRVPVPEGLFKDTERKFPEHGASTRQGVWIVSSVCYIQDELEECFNELNSVRIQFAVLGSSWREYELLSRNQSIRSWLELRFSLPPAASR